MASYLVLMACPRASTTACEAMADCAATARRLAAQHDALVDELDAVDAELTSAPRPSRRRGELLDTRWRVAGEADELRAAVGFALRCLVRCVATARRAEADRREAG